MSTSRKQIIYWSSLFLVTSEPRHSATRVSNLKRRKNYLETGAGNRLEGPSRQIVAEELEKEKGGSGLRYSFDIRQGHFTQEVGVDAKSGVVLENAPEGPNPD